MENNNKTFAEYIKEIEAAFKQGDMTEIVKRSGYSAMTVRKLFTRTMAVELTPAESKVLDVCNDYFAPRFEEARQREEATAKMIEG